MAMLGSHGGWVVLTGASAGIGEAFARVLAAERVNLARPAHGRAAGAGVDGECGFAALDKGERSPLGARSETW